MVVRVAERAALSKASRVVVAADSDRIVQACRTHGVEAVLTRGDHPSGSDRLAEAARLLSLAPNELVVNVQGDEPLISPALIDAVAALLGERQQAGMSTAAHAITDVAEYLNPNVVKVVLDASAMAMYFSRAPIPWWRDGAMGGVSQLPPVAPLRHIGIYGYRVAFLQQFPGLQQAPVEVCEALEQMRALWHGHRIAVHVTGEAPGPGVDTPADLERVRLLF
jgi:3-deoxy-manno-octulosonate cytidylyltransferase (CMP-KDO synthetase)